MNGLAIELQPMDMDEKRTTVVTPITIGLFLAMGGIVTAAQGQVAACSRQVAPYVAAGWRAFRASAIEEAFALFQRSVDECPDDLEARVGLGYALLRLERPAASAAEFQFVLARHADNIDALMGMGLLAWRASDLEQVREWFTRVQALDPANPEAARYLDRLPPLVVPPTRPPFVRPDTLTFASRIQDRGFEILVDGTWEPFYVKGINLGAALPGRYPSEFPAREVYDRWIADIAELGANTIRVYTIHPPDFYDALAAYNANHPRAPLRIIHGVWTELPPGHDFNDDGFVAEFRQEMHRVIDVIHGRATIQPRPGHAAGHYAADVAEWTLAFIIGREWESGPVQAFNVASSADTTFMGRYLSVRAGTPMDVWLARQLDALITYETEIYGWQRPVTYTNWPTLDPLHHVTEATGAEELAIRREWERGAEASAPVFDNEDDAAGVDVNLLGQSDGFRAGIFASYHAYPYYPDFMILDPEYRAAEGPFGPSNYFGYLTALKKHHRDIPVLIAEYGVPASMGSAHLQPQGFHHGGVTEADAAALNARLTREIAAAGLAGGVFFSWIDEWFKRNWLVTDFEIPLDHNRLWLNRLDPEQQYGVVAIDPVPPVEGSDLAARMTGWDDVRPLYRTRTDGLTVRAATDAAYLWLLVQPTSPDATNALTVGFDVIDPARGGTRWPADVGGARIPVGVEFVLHVREADVRLLATPSANPFTHVPIPARENPDLVIPEIDRGLPGLFTDRVTRVFNWPFRSEVHDDGVFEPLLVLPNRRRFARDSVEYAGIGYDRGILREGEPPDGAWQRDDTTGALEVRIPWQLLNVTDPSHRYVLESPRDEQGTPLPAFGARPVDDIGIVAVWYDRDRWRSIPASGSSRRVARFSWTEWDTPQWRARRRPAFHSIQAAFRELPATHRP